MIRTLAFLAMTALAPASAQAGSVVDEDFFRCGYFNGAMAVEAFPEILPSDDEVDELHRRASVFGKAARAAWVDHSPKEFVAKMIEVQREVDKAYESVSPEEFRTAFEKNCSAAEMRATAILNELGVDLYEPEDHD